MSIILKSGNSVDLINSDGAGNIQVNVKAPVDSANNVLISGEGRKATYRVSSGSAWSGAAGISSLLIGSATKKVKLVRVEFNCNAPATNALVQIQIAKYSTNPTAGTSATQASAPNDSADVAATAVYKTYSVTPTAGTLVGNVGTWVVATPPNNTSAYANPINYVNCGGGPGEKPLILNNANECFGFLVSQVCFFNLTLIWTEE